MEHTCEFCKNQKITYIGYIGYAECEIGKGAYYECQCACTDDYFEPKDKTVKPTILEGACFNYKIDQEEKDIDRTVKYLRDKYIDK